jgi:hypothetical protein
MSPPHCVTPDMTQIRLDEIADAIIETADTEPDLVKARLRIAALQWLYERTSTRDDNMAEIDHLLVCRAAEVPPGLKPMPGKSCWWVFREVEVWPDAPPLAHRDLQGALGDVFDHLRSTRAPTNVTVTWRTDESWRVAPLPDPPIGLDAILHGSTMIILCPREGAALVLSHAFNRWAPALGRPARQVRAEPAVREGHGVLRRDHDRSLRAGANRPAGAAGVASRRASDAVRRRCRGLTRQVMTTDVEALLAKTRDGKVVVTGKVSGDFPGSPINLVHIFEIEDRRIVSLEIRP